MMFDGLHNPAADMSQDIANIIQLDYEDKIIKALKLD